MNLDPNEKWGQKRGCFTTNRTVSFTNWNQAVWSQCLYNCATSGFFFAALHSIHCMCLKKNEHDQFTNVDDRRCVTDCPFDYFGKQCGGENGEISLYRTMRLDDRCSSVNLGSPHQFNKIMLASHPGSGNTWTRYLIEKASGYYTGSVADDNSLYNGGFKGEFEKENGGTVIVVKAHRYVKSGASAILLIRNPYEAIMSELNRRRGHGHTSHADSKEFYTQFWRDLVRQESGRWFNLYRQYIENKEVKIVYFEDLKGDLRHTMTDTIKFIENMNNHTLHVTDKNDRIDCLVIDSQGEFKREKKTLEFDPYEIDETMIPRVNNFITLLNETLIHKQLQTIPTYYLKENKTNTDD